MVTNLARTIDDIKERNIWVIGTDEKCDLLVRIPMAGEVGSLNVSVATRVCLFESVLRRHR